jgi:hypothetical protein
MTISHAKYTKYKDYLDNFEKNVSLLSLYMLYNGIIVRVLSLNSSENTESVSFSVHIMTVHHISNPKTHNQTA